MGACQQKLKKFMPHLSQVAAQAAYAGMNILNKVALQHGMNHFVFVTYRQTVATLAIAPFAYVLERHQRPPMTLSISFQIFLLALCGITINQNICLEGLYYTNSTFASAILNLIPPITFVMATSLRLENVNIKSRRGQAKVAGIIISVGGAMVMTLYKGPEIKMLTANLNGYNSKANNTVLGSMLLFGGVVAWAAWIIFQAPVVREYPAQLSLTAIMCFLGALQSGVIALVYAHKTWSVWIVGWNIELLSYVYSGMICSAFTIFVQAWCIHKIPQPSTCVTSQSQAGTTGLENDNQTTKGSSGHITTAVQNTPNISRSTSSTSPSLITSVPMMMFPNNYKGHIPVLQGTSTDKNSCVEFLYASIAQTGTDLSQEERIISDNQIESSEYELVQPCSIQLRPGFLASEIAGRFSRAAPVDIQYSQSLISMKSNNSNPRVTEPSKGSLNLQIFSTSSNDVPAALSSMKNGASNWILNGSSADSVRTYDKIHETAESPRSAYDPAPRNDAVIKWDEV